MRKKFLISTFIMILGGGLFCLNGQVSATSCNDLEVIFVRGSGAEKDTNSDYLNFKSELESKLKLTKLSYNFTDLDYPAVSVPNNLNELVGVYVSGGAAYDFGKSVAAGEEKLRAIINSPSDCPNTKFVLAGYSQGAMTITKTLAALNSERIIYVATFGDPKLYLPEGRGVMPPACQGMNLSDYRIYVPDCHAYQGLLGGIDPYEPSAYRDKLGTWCNKFDIFCSSYFSISSHVSYVKDNLYKDAAKLIFSKITKAFKIKNNYISEHDTAILIDSTGSMNALFGKYKTEALNLAERTLVNGGRVALYDYRDISENYQPRKHCDFETCTMKILKKELDEMKIDGGGDTPESLLSAAFNVMKGLNWRLGSTKSLVILTDAGYHEPDLDGVSMADVVKLSKNIDPVNFYVITDNNALARTYTSLVEATDGLAVTSADDLSFLTNQIMERFDSLPRVEELDFQTPTLTPTKPVLKIINTNKLENGVVEINFTNTGEKALIILNEAILGMTEQNKIVLSELDAKKENLLTLVPISGNMRGDNVTVDLIEQFITERDGLPSGAMVSTKIRKSIKTEESSEISGEDFIPKTPNTGKATWN